MILKQTFWAHIYVLLFSITFYILILLFWAYKNYDNDVLLVCGLFHTFFTIPAILIHISYTRKNWNMKIKICEKCIIIISKGSSKEILKSNVKKVTFFQSAGLDKSSFPMSGMDFYRYIRLTTINDENFFITCLMTTKIKEVLKQFPNIPFERVKGFAILRSNFG